MSKRVIGRFQRPSVPWHELSLHPACVRKPREPTILGSLSGAVVGGTEARQEQGKWNCCGRLCRRGLEEKTGWALMLQGNGSC